VKRTAVFIIISAVLFVATIAGCGPSPSATPTPTPSPTATLLPGQEPVEVVSATGPLEPINPGGPIVEITLKNVSDEPVISLGASLEVSGIADRPFEFTFDVTPSKPLEPGKAISSRKTLIGGGFGDNIPYTVTINGTLQSNFAFAYTKSVFITSPPE
jgi:hypothetical protein